MPRQLPWLNKNAGSGAKPKQSSRAKRDDGIPSDIDDDTFESLRRYKGKGKGKARAVENSDDLLDLLPPSKPTSPRKVTQLQDGDRDGRAPSSSPPPSTNIEPVPVEYMHKAESTFNLQDDEWMMVEDELLETAKLFTRHMHMAEYARLKKQIEEKKKEAEISRPIATSARFSATGAMKEKAKVQEKKQRMAIKDIFASQNSDDLDGDSPIMPPPKTSFPPPSRTGIPATSRSISSRSTSSTTTQTHHIPPAMKQSTWPTASTALDNSDSDDLDAPRPSKAALPRRPQATNPPPNRSNTMPTYSRPTAPKTRPNPPRSPPPPPPTEDPVSPSPASRHSRPARTAHPDLFDMLGDYDKPKVKPRPTAHHARPFSPLKPASTQHKPASTQRRSVDFASELDTFSTARTAKRKAEIERAEKVYEKKVVVKREDGDGDAKKVKKEDLDDIPTFLF